MKSIALIGSVVVALAALVGLVAAMNFGEASPIFVSGKIKLSEEMAKEAEGIDTLFFIVFDEDSPRPMPYGAMRERIGNAIAEGKREFDFFITKERLMVMDRDLDMRPNPERIRLKIRFDRDGLAGPDQPGDLTGEVSDIALGSKKVTVHVERLIE